ncbi:putative pentatricopeptide repeat-containing protein At1g12700, mitochondrial [Abrus precatorius]|uniref:Pentatricopeptide repeat-containing protein At1g12700, mitochondrial n=1 Tax=Abrus precatorius TaxID=3816 RepID=A0A8B8LM84_ABRPR|nr:putative pentatricopeptide repeat-containing protein At1g12700, mitochondrial [Abrus precatorius]
MSFTRLRHALFPRSYSAKLHTHSSLPLIHGVHDSVASFNPLPPVIPVVHDAVASFNSMRPSPFIHDVDPAVASFNRMLNVRPCPPITQFNKILGSLARDKRFETVILLFPKLQYVGILPNLVSLCVLINCCCQVRHRTLALSVLAKIFRLGYLPSTIVLTTLLNGLFLTRNAEEAMYLRDKMAAQEFQMDQIRYWILIYGLCEVGEAGFAIQLLRHAEGHLIQPSVEAYIMYRESIKRLCEDELLYEACDCVSEMVTRGIQPNCEIYHSIIHGFCRLDQVQEAVGLFNEMLLKSINPKVYTLVVLMDVLSKYGKVREAKTALAVMVIREEKDEDNKAEKLLPEIVASGSCKDKVLDAF